MDKYLGKTISNLDEETKKMISNEVIKPIHSGRDISLPSTIMTYKVKLASSISDPRDQQKMTTSNDT